VAQVKATPERSFWLIEAYVSWVNTCGPCPPRAKCKRCNRPHAALSDSREPYSGDEIVIYGQAVARWQPGSKILLYISRGADGQFEVNRRMPPRR